MKPSLLAAAAACVMSSATGAYAAEYYVDPNAAGAGEGTQSEPWASLEEAIDGGGVEAGDTVWLMSGAYGELRIDSINNEAPVTIAAAEGQKPTFTSVLVRNSAAWALRGLHVVAESAGFLIDLDGSNEDVRVEGCVLMSTPDASGWSARDWIDRASSGIGVDGTRMTIRGNRLTNVAHGISVSADNSVIEGNLIENFSRDGLRGLGDYNVFENNTVKNSYSVDDHHDDGFQSWSVGEGGVGTGEVVGVVLRGNTFINYEDANQPHRGSLQGIGCFDGTFVDWVVENNVVITDHWHGITLLGARNSTVVNNTVTDPNGERPGPPWISIQSHKNGTAPTGCVVRNNLTTALNNAEGVLEDKNITFAMDEASTYFVAPDGRDLHLHQDAPAVDAGTATGAPPLDRDRIPRPQGDGIDVGAYEWHDGSAEPRPPSDPSDPGDSSDSGDPTEPSVPSDPSDPSGPGQPRAAEGDSRKGGCALRYPERPDAGAFLVLLTVLLLRRQRRQ